MQREVLHAVYVCDFDMGEKEPPDIAALFLLLDQVASVNGDIYIPRSRGVQLGRSWRHFGSM